MHRRLNAPVPIVASTLILVVCLTAQAGCTPASTFTVSGQVSGAWQCVNAASSRMPTIVSLKPLAQETSITHSGPEFRFEGIPNGDYSLVVACTALGRPDPFPGVPVKVAGADVQLDVILPFPTLPRFEPVRTFSGHRAPILDLAFTTDGALVSVDETGQVFHWDSETGQAMRSWHYDPSEWPAPVLLSPGGRLLAVATANGPITIWDTSQGKTATTLEGLTASASNMTFSDDGAMLAVWQDGESREILLWDVLSGRSLTSLNVDQEPRNRRNRNHLVLLPEAPHSTRKAMVFVYDGRDWAAQTWDIQSGELVGTLPAPLANAGQHQVINSTAVSPDGSRIAFGLSGVENYGRVALWNVDANQVVDSGYELGLANVAFSPDARWLASTAFDNTAVLWDPGSGLPTAILVGDVRGVTQPTWTAFDGGMWLAAADGQNKILIWEIS